MAEYYRTIFTINEKEDNGSGDEGLYLMLKIEKMIKAWAGEQFGEELNAPNGEWNGENGNLQLIGRLSGSSGLFWLIWERPGFVGQEPEWRLSFRVATEGNDIEADVEVRSMYGENQSIDNAFLADPPLILDDLFEQFQCSLNGIALATKADRIDQWNAVEFVNEVVSNAERHLPVVLVSEYIHGGSVVDADDLQMRLLGVAIVATCNDEAGWALNKELRPLMCYNGTVRVYSAGFSTDDSSLRHPYWLAQKAKSLGSLRLSQILRDECINRLPNRAGRAQPKMFSRVRQKIRRETFEDLRQRAQESAEKTAELDAFIKEFDIEDSRNSDRIAELENQLLYSENEKEQLRHEVEQLKIALSNSNKNWEFNTESNQNHPTFHSVLDVVDHCSENLNGIRFLENAKRMARDTIFVRPHEIYQVFRNLSQCAVERQKNNALGIDVQSWLQARGVNYIPRESETTMGKYGSERIFRDEITKNDITMPAHIKLNGNNIRIHIHWDADNSIWLVGYVGPHLTTASG